jgi:hypothetical protein
VIDRLSVDLRRDFPDMTRLRVLKLPCKRNSTCHFSHFIHNFRINSTRRYQTCITEEIREFLKTKHLTGTVEHLAAGENTGKATMKS